ncbi:hypothetical protein EV424DRAFT_1534815 [Suillus variegatus]|nr:hypothetical protein EV424DRAFT_1534815 [Suillus variegatus]
MELGSLGYIMWNGFQRATRAESSWHNPLLEFVTGSSSGFGRAMVEEVLHNGEIAVATLRKPSVLDNLAA